MAIDKAKFLLAWTLAVIPTLFGLLCIWWLLEPAPVTVQYVAPALLSQAVKERPGPGLYVYESPGNRTLYRWVEYCVSRPFRGTVHRSWVGKAIVWPAPDLPTVLSRDVGCHGASIAVEIPSSAPSRDFQLVQTMTIELSPIRTVEIEYPPLPLRILAPAEGCSK